MTTPVLCVYAVLLAAVGNSEAAAQTLQRLYETGNVEFEENVVFGSYDDEDEGVLFGPVAICVDGDDNVYVLDYKMYCIHKFDVHGQHLMAFSRKGEGPGELTRAYRMTMTAEENLLVFDSGNHRFTVLDRDGEHVDSRGFQGWITGIHSSSDGSIIVLYSLMKEDWREKGSFYRVARLAPDLATETTIDSGYVQGSVIVQSSQNSMTSVSKPYVAGFAVGVAPAGDIVLAHGDEYRIRLLSPDLRLVREITRDVPRIEVTDEDKEEYFERFNDSEENFQNLVRQKVEFPGHKPYIRSLRVDDEGYILVGVYDRTGSEETQFYDVFTPDGDFLNRVEMMALDPTALFEGGHLYMTKSSEDELPVVIRYRPRSAAPAASP